LQRQHDKVSKKKTSLYLRTNTLETNQHRNFEASQEKLNKMSQASRSPKKETKVR